MALSRPFVLAALAALLCAATFVSLQSANQRAEASSDATAPVVTQVPKAPASAKGAKPGTAAAKPKAKPKPKAAAKPDPGVPPRVKRALASGDKVVIFFRQPGADDAATAKAVNALKPSKKLKVFRDSIDHLGRYRRVVSELGISQAPAVVVVGKSRKAVLIEGFVDPGSLNQQVRDAR